MESTLRRGGCGLAVLLGLNLLLTAPVSAAHRAERAKPEMQSLTPPPGNTRMEPADGGQTVHDGNFGVTWLADANLPAKEKFGVHGINSSGSMNYTTAVAWVRAMNAHKYLGHDNWTLPTTPAVDQGCNSHKYNDFGFGCTLSGLGSLYHNTLGLNWPSSAVAISGNSVGPFKNFQPNFYWTDEKSQQDKNGYKTFSFNTGLQGSNTDQNYFYVLPMIRGKLRGTPDAKGKELQVNPGGETVYDPVADVTWPADANLAATEKFGIPVINAANGIANFSPTGGMTHAAALAWIQAMNAGKGYLDQKKWELPPLSKPGAKGECGSADPVSGCAGNPLGELFYNQLHGKEGQPVTPVPDVRRGAFHNFQPYLYWSCEGDAGETVCSTKHPFPAQGYGASFNFGDGFQGSDLENNNLYVTVYYPDPQRPMPIKCAPGTKCPKPM